MKLTLIFFCLFILNAADAQQKADTTWKQSVGDVASLGMLLADGTPILLNGRTIKAVSPEDGHSLWEVSVDANVDNISYYSGTPYLNAGGYVINPLNGTKLNLGLGAKTKDDKPVDVIRNYIFPQQNVVLVYGKVRQGVIEGNIDEVFCAIDYTTGKTFWTRNDMFKSTEQKQPKKGFGGFLKQVGSELIKDDLQKFDDSKNAGERFLTQPLGSKEGTLILPLNLGVYAVDYKTGNLLWKKEYASKKKGFITTKTSSPTCVISFNEDSTKVYVSRADFTDALDVKTGKSIWDDPMPSAGPASFLHLTRYGLLSLPTKDVTLLQKKRIFMFDAKTGQEIWEIKSKYGVQAFIPIGDTVVLNLQNTGDKESVNLLLMNKGVLLFEKNTSVDGNILNMKSVAAGILVVSDEEICIINKLTGEKISSLSKTKNKQWILTKNDNDLFVMVSGSAKLYKIDFSNGTITNPVSEGIDFKGGEDPTAMEWYNGNLLITSSQNICYVDTKQQKIIYQKYYKAPGRTTFGKILSGAGATLSFTLSLAQAGTTLLNGYVTGAFITSDMSSLCYDLYPKETNEFVAGQLQSIADGAALTAGEFKLGLGMIKSIGKRFKDTRLEENNMYVMGSDAELGFVLLKVSKMNGEVQRTIALKKRDKNPDYIVDDAGKCIYYIPRMTLGEEFKSIITGKGIDLYKINLQ